MSFASHLGMKDKDIRDADNKKQITPNQDIEKAPEKNKVPAGDPPKKQPEIIDPERRSGAV